ncbi:PaaI family thioesterase [Noviherbaspirillum sp.]|uniref:PaaI family thioesterase n=1 Tax=Noviherbaspirillum sp. TaxID=1926288 RepID=UPI002FE24C94
MTDPWEPLYSRKTDTAIILGLHVARQHTNARGMAHGGLISALADNAMGLSCVAQFPEPRSLLTVNLALDFIGIAKLGQWLQFETNFTKIGSTLCFAHACITADGKICAQARATFRTVGD